MKALEFESNIAKIYSDEEGGYVLLQWLSPTIHSEYVEAMNQFLKILAAGKFTKSISDICLLGALSEQSIQYIREEVAPFFENMDKTALIISRDVFDKMITENMLENFDLGKSRSFSSSAEALAWIIPP